MSNTNPFRWLMTEPGKRLEKVDLALPKPGAGEVLVKVVGCGVCHTDLGFLYDGVRTKHELPLALGHEIAGEIVEVGTGCEDIRGRAVIVPAVIPCGSCDICSRGRGAICPHQKMPGNDIHGGFASHILVPSYGLCLVDDPQALKGGPVGRSEVSLAQLSVIADAVTTPYQAILRSGLREGDVAIVIGLGGVGGFAAQIAAAQGATVVGIDIKAERLDLMSSHGVSLALNPAEVDFKSMRKEIQGFVKENKLPRTEWKIFECSGTGAGQTTAFGLMTYGSHLAVVGFTLEKVPIRLSNLMAFDARADGNWGCIPEHYPRALETVTSGKVKVGPFAQNFAMDEINDVLEGLREHKIDKRPVLIP